VAKNEKTKELIRKQDEKRKRMMKSVLEQRLSAMPLTMKRESSLVLLPKKTFVVKPKPKPKAETVGLVEEVAAVV
jgi:hypothetical protein